MQTPVVSNKCPCPAGSRPTLRSSQSPPAFIPTTLSPSAPPCACGVCTSRGGSPAHWRLTGRLPWVDVRASTTWAKGNLWEKDVHTHQAEEKGFQKEWGQSAGPLVPFPMQILLHSSRRFPRWLRDLNLASEEHGCSH